MQQRQTESKEQQPTVEEVMWSTALLQVLHTPMSKSHRAHRHPRTTQNLAHRHPSNTLTVSALTHVVCNPEPSDLSDAAPSSKRRRISEGRCVGSDMDKGALMAELARAKDAVKSLKTSRSKLQKKRVAAPLRSVKWTSGDATTSCMKASLLHHGKKSVVAALHKASRGLTPRMVKILLAVLKDKGMSDAVNGVEGEDAAKLRLAVSAVTTGTDELKMEAMNNLLEVLQKLKSRGNKALNLKNNIILRRSLVASVVPTDVDDDSILKRYGKLLNTGKMDIKSLQKIRKDFMSGDQNEMCIAAEQRGRKCWITSAVHQSWHEQLITWLEDEQQSRVAPGKRGMAYKHFNEKGESIAYHSPANKSNPECKCYDGLCQKHAVHWKNYNDIELHRRFLRDHPNVNPTQMTRQRFTSLLPYWLQKKPRDVCACPYHAQATCLLESCKIATKDIHKDCSCSCQLCADGGCQTYCDNFDNFLSQWECKSDTDFSKLYENEEPNHVQAWMKKVTCTLGNCDVCGDYTSVPCNACPLERAAHQKMVSWTEIVKEPQVVQTSAGVKERKNTHKKRFTGRFEELKSRLMMCFGDMKADWKGWTQDESFRVHRFVKNWQSSTLDRTLSKLDEHSACAIIDYAMNYTHAHEEEFSEEHFCPWTSTLLPIVVHFKDPETGQTHAETYCVLSDDNRHDHQNVQAIMKDVIQYHRIRFAKNGRVLKFFWVWSDGCAAQFKTASIFGWLTHIYKVLDEVSPSSAKIPIVTGVIPDDNKDQKCNSFEHFNAEDECDGLPLPYEFAPVHVAWSFFQSAHGKGPSDAENSAVKNFLLRLEQHGWNMPYTVDLVPKLLQLRRSSRYNPDTKTFETGRKKKLHSIMARQIAFYPSGSIDRKSSVRVDQSVSGTRTHYRYSPTQDYTPHKVRMGWLSCACTACLTNKKEVRHCRFRKVVNARTGHRMAATMKVCSARLNGPTVRAVVGRQRRAIRNLNRKVVPTHNIQPRTCIIFCLLTRAYVIIQIADAIRTCGKFTFCHAAPDADGNNPVVKLGSGVLLTVDPDGDNALAHHELVRVGNSDNRFVEEPQKADSLVKLEDVILPINFRIAAVRGEPGTYRVAPGVVQAIKNAEMALLDG